MKITQQELKEILHYDTETGVFLWKISRGKAAIGKRAGFEDKYGNRIYRRINIGGKRHAEGHLAWLYIHGVWPTYDIHHINRNPHDNRICNLQDLPREQNLALRDFKNPPIPYKTVMPKWNPPKRNTKLTQEFLHEFLDYNSETGIFLWKKRRGCIPAGCEPRCVHKHGYKIVCLTVGGAYKKYLSHRLAWFYVHGIWPEGDIDHINGDKADNRIINLRDVTRVQNMANAKSHKNTKSGLKGISREDTAWKAQFTVNGKKIRVGRFKTKEEAYIAYCEAVKRINGEFARVA